MRKQALRIKILHYKKKICEASLVLHKDCRKSVLISNDGDAVTS